MKSTTKPPMKWPNKSLHTSDGNKPHPSWGGWRNFLKSCEIRDKYRGVIYFGKTNCNYIMFTDGLIIENYGYHGHALMSQIREEGVTKVKSNILKIKKEIQDIMNKLKALTSH